MNNSSDAEKRVAVLVDCDNTAPEILDFTLRVVPRRGSLKRTDQACSPQTHGHSGLLDMIRTYGLLQVNQESSCHWSVKIVPKTEDVTGPNAPGAADH
ncbi:MAG: hypothetical protein U1D25_03930 [Hydrogenophaga sp.]|uniref:hypothetical protein n=1 Tax=Hydrogenophaga sp. TaxID=1904254 RepID=UPI002762933F|nr:hypothetical protein [Hydrogenophaga sp.]MDP2418292.1 hypothetical protein [Hydrogenophaga sp.]MDZ4187250.1 hypothetical protein [Hydrogenophaga sp.]